MRLIAALGIVAACTTAGMFGSVRFFEWAWKRGWVDLAPVPVLEIASGVALGLTVGVVVAWLTLYRHRGEASQLGD